MVTTIQVTETTLELLKKVKEESKAASYDRAIAQIILKRENHGSMAGSLGKYLGKQNKVQILAGLRDTHDRI